MKPYEIRNLSFTKTLHSAGTTSNKKPRNHYGIRLEDVSTNYEHLSVTQKLNRNLLKCNLVYHMQMPSPTRRRKRAHQQLLTRSMEVSNLPYCAGQDSTFCQHPRSTTLVPLI